MTTQIRPRLEEFLLALLWLVGTCSWGYFGVIGYATNVLHLDDSSFNLIGFILSFFLLSMTVFGLRFVLNTFRRLWSNAPSWLDTGASLLLGFTLITGSLFSLFSLIVTLVNLFDKKISNLVFGESLAASLIMLGLIVVEILAMIQVFVPFLGHRQDPNERKSFSRLQNIIYGPKYTASRQNDQLQGPLLLENDTRTNLLEEKTEGRVGLEKTLVAHGGYHITTVGFTANGAVIFTVSDGGTVHFQSGGRKGTMFPPELKFWDLSTSRVQTASMGAPQIFLTNQYKTPPSLQDYRFLVPAGGSKFAWIKPDLIQVGNWNNDHFQKLNLDEGLVLRGWNGFVPLAFNPEGSRLAWCSSEGQTRLWNLDSDQVQPLRAYPTEPDSPTGSEKGAWGLVFSPDGTRIATLGGQGILLQNVYTGWRWFRPFEDQDEKLTAFAFSNSGFEMAIGLLARPIVIRLGRAGRKSNGNGLVSAADKLASYEPERFVPIVRLWDLREDRYTDLLVGESPLRELAYSPDNRWLAGVDEAGLLRLWDVPLEGSVNRAPRMVSQFDLGLSGRKVIVAFTPDIQKLICATDNRVLLWNLARLRQEAQV